MKTSGIPVLSLALAVAAFGQAAGRYPAAKSPAATKPAPGAKAEEPEPKIEGIEIPYGERGYLGIQIVGSSFKLTFYDRKKKPVAPDVDRAALRWDPKYKVGDERVVLNPDPDGTSLSSPRNIRPPYNFKLFITLIKEAAEGQSPATETIVVDFRQ